MILSISEDILEKIKSKCGREKRSLTSQLRKLVEMIQNNKILGNHLKWKYSKNKEISSNFVKTAVKLPEDEYWTAAEKAAKAFMTPAEFCAFVLGLWEDNDLPFSVYDAGETAAGSGDIEDDGYMETKLYTEDELKCIDIKCQWNEEAMNIRWKADYFSGILCAIFTDDKTSEILSEFSLGKKLEGEITIESNALGFNPALKKWTPQIILKMVDE